MRPAFHISSLFICSFVFIRFLSQLWVIWQFRVVCSSPPHRRSHAVSWPPAPPRRPRTEREEICFCHMLIYSEMPAEAERYLFPRSCRESDGDCYGVFISSAQCDELLQPHMETFSDTLLSKQQKTRCLSQRQQEAGAAQRSSHFYTHTSSVTDIFMWLQMKAEDKKWSFTAKLVNNRVLTQQNPACFSYVHQNVLSFDFF